MVDSVERRIRSRSTNKEIKDNKQSTDKSRSFVSPYPDQMVDQHLETTSTALNVSGDQGT